MTDLQLKTLDIFKVIKKICDENNIRYFAIAGTAIGAVRHSGFIPWDDDIDIAMPRADYYRFMSTAKILLPEGIEAIDYTRGSDSHVMIGRVYDSNTALVPQFEIRKEKARYSGVAVDIMPLDGVPSNYIIYRVHMLFLSLVYSFNAAALGTASKGGRLRMFMVLLPRVLFREFAKKGFMKRCLNSVNEWNSFDSAKFLARTWGFAGHDGMQTKARYYTEDFSDYISMPFEDTEIRVPRGFDRYLSSVYPGYMKLPAETDRKSRHSDGIVDLVHSYRYHEVRRDGKTIGYANGCFDMLHVGHLNILRKSKQNCDYLIVGVNTDSLTKKMKGRLPIVNESQRAEVLRSIKYVDEVHLIDESTDKFKKAYQLHKYDVVFVGDDHRGEKTWSDLEEYLGERGSRVHYIEYTQHISSTKLRALLNNDSQTEASAGE